jgi:hypothetical protein
MNKTMSIFGAIIFASLILTSCSRTIKTSNTVGDWYHEVSKNMGGYNITSKTKLTVIRIEAGVYEYKIATTVIDEKYGGDPKTQYSSGKFEENIKDNKWLFSGGDFGERGGYISIPSDEWDDYKPKSLTVNFANGRGNSMTFSSSNSNDSVKGGSDSDKGGSGNSSEEDSKKAYRQGYSDGQTGYGLPASERVSASEFYLSRGYNYSSADYYVYEMGFNDGV